MNNEKCENPPLKEDLILIEYLPSLHTAKHIDNEENHMDDINIIYFGVHYVLYPDLFSDQSTNHNDIIDISDGNLPSTGSNLFEEHTSCEEDYFHIKNDYKFHILLMTPLIQMH